jgi:hypothetical protein
MEVYDALNLAALINACQRNARVIFKAEGNPSADKDGYVRATATHLAHADGTSLHAGDEIESLCVAVTRGGAYTYLPIPEALALYREGLFVTHAL